MRVGRVLIDLPDFCCARRISYRLCKFNQNSGDVPKQWAKRSAVSPVMARRPGNQLGLKPRRDDENEGLVRHG